MAMIIPGVNFSNSGFVQRAVAADEACHIALIGHLIKSCRDSITTACRPFRLRQCKSLREESGADTSRSRGKRYGPAYHIGPPRSWLPHC
jgi:hypothetical protein